MQRAIEAAIEKIHSKSKSIAKVFRQFDLNHDGTVDRNEFAQCMISFGIQGHEIDTLLHMVDKDGTNSIDYAEFVATFLPGQEETEMHNLFLPDAKPQGRKIILQNNTSYPKISNQTAINPLHRMLIDRIHKKYSCIREAFRSYDVNGNGRIEHKEFRHAAHQLGFYDNQVEKLIEFVDKNKKGYIDYCQFVETMSLDSDHQMINGMRHGEDKHRILPARQILPPVPKQDYLLPHQEKIRQIQNRMRNKDGKISHLNGLRKVFRDSLPDTLGFANRSRVEIQLGRYYNETNSDVQFLCSNLLPTSSVDVHRNHILRLLDVINRNETSLEKTSGRKRYDPERDLTRPDHWGPSPLIEREKPKSISFENVQDITTLQHYRDLYKVQTFIEQHVKHLGNQFKTRYPSGDSYYIHTKKSTFEIVDIMNKYGVFITAERLGNIIGHGEITCSEMTQRVHQAMTIFNTVNVQENKMIGNKKYHAGQYYGCRASYNNSTSDNTHRNHPSGKQHLSQKGFLAHNTSTEYDTSTDVSKLRWIDKRLEQQPVVGLGGNRRKMGDGHHRHRSSSMGSLLASSAFAEQQQYRNTHHRASLPSLNHPFALF